MKRLFLFICIASLVSNASSEDLYPKGYVDLGLPSGTLWKNKNEPGLFSFTEAAEKFGSRLPTLEQTKELVNLCKWVWNWDTNSFKVIGPNGKFITFTATGTWPCERMYSGTYYYYECDKSQLILKDNGGFWTSTTAGSPDGLSASWSLYFCPEIVKIYDTWHFCGEAVRLVYKTKAAIEAEQARIREEQERKEQLRRQEEQNRLKEQQLKEMPKRLPEIEKLVDPGSKTRLWSQSKIPEYLQYYRQIQKNSYRECFRLSLKFTKEGNLYMWSEIPDKFEELFHAMKLEGTIQQWESGHWTIDLSSSNQEIAKSINYILDQMAAAENSYRMKLWKSPQYEKEFQRSKNELSSILSHPLGNRNLKWMEPKKEFIKSIKSLYPELQIKKSNIYGRMANQKPFFRFGTNTNDRLKLDIVDIDLNKSKDGPIIVKYKLTTNSSKKDFGADYRIKMVLQDYMGFKCDYSTNEYAGEVNGIKIESLKIDILDDFSIELSFSVPREGKDATSTGKKEELAKKERERNNVNGHIAVDMGLSVRWADCNIGANHHYETGDYYAWGETSTKVSFPWNTYKHISNGKLIKYCSNSSSGRVDNKRILETQDDAAYVNWGNAWRIPTKEQWEELADNNKCKWEWTTDSGVYGYKVTSKITGNSIFLPVTGYKPGGTRIEHPELGLYWTSTLFTEQYDNGYLAAYRFDLGQTHYNCRGTHRCNGRAIRAVCR